MSFFKLNKTDYVDGPKQKNVRITFENLCSKLNEDIYNDGVDTESMINTISCIYQWLMGVDNGKAIVLPAPVNDPHDKYRTMWPEGAVVSTRSMNSRRGSTTSSVTSNGRRIRGLSPSYTSSKASSVISSRYAPVKNTFVEEDIVGENFRRVDIDDLFARNPELSKLRDKPDTENVVVPDQTSRRVGVSMKNKARKPVFAED